MGIHKATQRYEKEVHTKTVRRNVGYKCYKERINNILVYLVLDIIVPIRFRERIKKLGFCIGTIIKN